MKNTWTYEDQMVFESDLKNAILNAEPVIFMGYFDYIDREDESEDEFCYSFY